MKIKMCVLLAGVLMLNCKMLASQVTNSVNIYVTLGVVHWQADGEYELNTFIPEFETNSTPAASSPDNSDGFPVWYSIKHSKGN
jgi:P pilus assembly chaperone PapD